MRPLTRTRPLTEAELRDLEDCRALNDDELAEFNRLQGAALNDGAPGTVTWNPIDQPPPSRAAEIAARAILLLVIATGLFGIGALLIPHQ